MVTVSADQKIRIRLKASAGVREAQSFLMPHVTFSEQATRGNDPVYVFGSKLRQERFSVDDFSPRAICSPSRLPKISAGAISRVRR